MGQRQSATSPIGVTELVPGVIYEFRRPKTVEVEIVFIHGLQIGKFEDAYWKTWCARDQHKTCWPQSWIREKYPNARILSLSYNSEALQGRSERRLGPKELSENLLQQMVLSTVEIGQSDCPVIFVCHSLGGLIAKQIVVCAASENHRSQNLKIQKLLNNVQAFFFFATPHFGSNLVKSHVVQFAKRAAVLGCVKLTLVVKFLQVLNYDSYALNVQFIGFKSRYNWKLYVVLEGMETAFQACGMSLCSTWVVKRASGECLGPLHGISILQESDHRTVCKPENKQDSGFLLLLDCIGRVLDDRNRRVEDYNLRVEDQNRRVEYQDPRVEDQIRRLENQKVKLPAVFGLDHKVAEIRGLFQNGVPIVALVGMGGAGKTTLSKYYYNVELGNYKKSSYLEDITTKTKEEDLQRKLFSDLFPDEKVHTVDNSHLDRIKQCLKNEKVLVVVDIVEESPKDSCPPGAIDLGFDEVINGTKVVLTCRNPEHLRRFGLGLGSVQVVEVIGIRDANRSDMALFHHHAFGVDFDDLKDTFKELAEGILEQCDGLPLSLEVIGEYLNDVLVEEQRMPDRKKRWGEALEGLKGGKKFTGEENEKLWSRLQVSYDQLAPLERVMFLAYACIFSEDSSLWYTAWRNRVEWIWDSRSGIQHLIKRSLIKAEGQDNQELSIHNQLRDMGRKIVEDESKGDISKQTYIWKSEDVLRFLQNNESSATVRGLSLSFPYEESTLWTESWADEALKENSSKQYSQMQLLHLYNVDRSHVVDYCLSKCSKQNLRWLSLNCCEITDKGLQRIWLLEGLRVLQIHFIDELEEIPEALGNLTNLVELEILGCDEITSLPSNAMGKLIHLKSLTLGSCDGLLTIPPEVFRLPELESLAIVECDKLKIMCDFESDMVYELQELFINSDEIRAIKGLGNLHKLRRLKLVCPKLDTCDLPGSLEKLSQLETCVVYFACEAFSKELGDAFMNVSEQELPNLRVLRLSFMSSNLRESPRWRNAINEGMTSVD